MPNVPDLIMSSTERQGHVTVVLEEGRNLRHPELLGPIEAFAEMSVVCPHQVAPSEHASPESGNRYWQQGNRCD